ncbi:MAG: iron ABC transporter permease [Methanococcoides sp.]|nr:iron ABC transporter permease [Methanococcoides sp.]
MKKGSSADNCSIKNDYDRLIGRKILFISVLFAAILLIIGISSTIGVIGLSIKEVYLAIFNGIFPNTFEVSDVATRVVLHIRLPRICLGILAGIGLGMSGAVMQGILRNPLASPYTLGISSGAGFGAAIAIVLGAGIAGGEYLVIGNAFIGALICSIVILLLSSKRGTTTESMLLAGIALMYLFSASTALLQYFADDEASKEVTFWLIGSLSYATWDKILAIAIVIAITFPILLWKSNDLNLMVTGDDTAKSMGIDVERTRLILMVLASLLTASIVCFTGTIGFIGLVAPHMTRMIIGGDHRFVLPASALLGGLLLCFADIFAITILEPIILPIGIMTAYMGVPLFLYLILKRQKAYW